MEEPVHREAFMQAKDRREELPAVKEERMGETVRQTVHRNRPKSRRTKAAIKFAAICLLLFVAGLGLLFVFRVKEITVENYTIYSEEEIIDRVMTAPTDQLSILLWLRLQFSPLPEIPFVERIDVSLADRNTVVIHAYQKLVTGCVKVMGGYMYFDKDGMVVECSSELLDGIPVITGLKFDQVVLYEPLKIQKESLFLTILDLTRLVLKYELPVTEVAFQPNFEVVLTCGGHRVLLGEKDSYELTMNALPGILDSLGEGKYQIDMRSYRRENQNVIAKPLED